jgi:hypothetical protein
LLACSFKGLENMGISLYSCLSMLKSELQDFEKLPNDLAPFIKSNLSVLADIMLKRLGLVTAGFSATLCLIHTHSPSIYSQG